MLTYIPIWVPVVFMLLLYLGYKQSKPREVRVKTLVVIALVMFGFSFYGIVSAFGAEPVALVVWAAA